MKKIFLILLSISLIMAAPLTAQKKKSLLLKSNKQDGILRIVFESDEAFINKIKVTTSPSQVKMEFSEPYDLKFQQDPDFEIMPSEKSLTINLKETAEIKFFKLSAPARLVLDIQTRGKSQGKQPVPEKQTSTEKQPPPVPHRGIVIDAGHGGYDFGITSINGNEKDVSLFLAKDLGAALSKKGKKVFLTRKADQHITIADRVNFVNQKSPDVFISLHASLSKNFVLYSPKFEDQGANEAVALYSFSSKQMKYIGKSKALADSMEKTIKEEFKGDVLRREMPLPLLNSAGAPAVLIEYPSPGFVVYDQQMKPRLINAIGNGIAGFGQ
jgi:N-acetylmuramoyl-L-alanine amidase